MRRPETQSWPQSAAAQDAELVRRWEALMDGVLDAIVLVRLEEIQREGSAVEHLVVEAADVKLGA